MSGDRASQCRAVFSILPQLSAGHVRHSTGAGRYNQYASNVDMAALESGDDPAQEYLQPSMQVKTGKQLCTPI